MSKTYTISSESYDSLITVNNRGVVTGATEPLSYFEGNHWHNVKIRAKAKNISIYNEVDTLKTLTNINSNISRLVDMFDLQEE